MSADSPSEQRLARIWWRGLQERRDEMDCPACGRVEPVGHRNGRPICECGNAEDEGGWR
jgi:hypothetical protein